MDRSHLSLDRIIVVTRPAFGRAMEGILRDAGHEVYRTTDDGILHDLVAQLRPHLVIVTLDVPWIDNGNLIHQVHHLITRHRPVSVLLLGEVERDPRIDGVPRLPLGVDTAYLLTTVDILLTSSHLGHE